MKGQGGWIGKRYKEYWFLVFVFISVFYSYGKSECILDMSLKYTTEIWKKNIFICTDSGNSEAKGLENLNSDII